MGDSGGKLWGTNRRRNGVTEEDVVVKLGNPAGDRLADKRATMWQKRWETNEGQDGGQTQRQRRQGRRKETQWVNQLGPIMEDEE